MAFDAVLGKQTFSERQVIDGTHPAVVVSMKVKANQGELPGGTIVAKDQNGEIVPYDPTGNAPVNEPIGVIVYTVDTSKETIAPVLRHGTVVKRALLVKGNAPSEADLIKLEKLGIFAL